MKYMLAILTSIIISMFFFGCVTLDKKNFNEGNTDTGNVLDSSTIFEKAPPSQSLFFAKEQRKVKTKEPCYRNSICVDDSTVEHYECNTLISTQSCSEKQICSKGQCICKTGWMGTQCQKCVIYIDGDNINPTDGKSWKTAYTTVHNGIEKASSENCAIWVAKGTYTPGDLPADSFLIKEGLELYGSFKGNETTIEQRDINLNQTILSGEISDTLKSYHILKVETNTLLDGFVIQDGNTNNEDEAEAYGAGILVNGKSVELKNLTFHNNHAFKGSAIYAQNASVNITNCTFGNNTSNVGAIYFDNVEATILKSIFQENDSMYSAGVFYLTSSNVRFNDSSFKNNSSGGSGGSIFAYSTDFKVSDCIFENNTSTNGGAVFYTQFSTFKSVNSEYIENSCNNYGGAISSDLSSESLLFNVFKRNHADKRGGAVSKHGLSPLEIYNCTFKENSATIGGGVHLNIFPSKEGNTSFIANTLFERNIATDYGGALNVESVRELDFINNTVVRNIAQSRGAGIQFYSSTPTIINSIIWGNLNNDATNNVQLDNSASSKYSFYKPLIKYSIIEHGCNATDFIICGAQIFTEYPQFLNYENDFRLSKISAAKDRGNLYELPVDTVDLDTDNNSTEMLPLDLDGNERLKGVSVDIGAFEF